MTNVLAPGTYQRVGARRLHEGVVQQIVAQILSGTLGPGAALPTEAELAGQFGVSRVTIREAVRILVAKGLVAVRQGSGMQVQSADQWNHLDPTLLFEQMRLGHDETLLTELLELRRIVEAEVAALAALRRTPEDLHALRVAVDGMRAVLDDPHTYTRLDIAFHEAVLVAARNRLLAQALRPASQALLVGRLISSQRPGGPAASIRGHEDILTAIEQGDQAQAHAAMLRHITQFEDDVHTSLDKGLAGNVGDLTRELDL